MKGYRPLVSPSAMKVIAPGETYEMAFAIGELPSGSRVSLSYRDEFEVDGDYGIPVLTNFSIMVIR